VTLTGRRLVITTSSLAVHPKSLRVHRNEFMPKASFETADVGEVLFEIITPGVELVQ